MATYRNVPDAGELAEALGALSGEDHNHETAQDLRGEGYLGNPPLGERLRRIVRSPFGAVPGGSIMPGAELMAHGNYGYPYRGSGRRLAIGGSPYGVSILLVLHITGNANLPSAQGEVTYSARAGSGASFTFATNREGIAGAPIVQALDPLTQAPWTNGDTNAPNMDLGTVARIHDGNPYNVNEFCLATVEQVGYPFTSPVSNPYQEELAAQIVAFLYRLAGGRIGISRQTVILHSDINSVTRANCAVPLAAKEAYVARIVARAKALVAPPESREAYLVRNVQAFRERLPIFTAALEATTGRIGPLHQARRGEPLGREDALAIEAVADRLATALGDARAAQVVSTRDNDPSPTP